MNKCPLCGGEIRYHGLFDLECYTSDCANGPKIDVPEGYELAWYYGQEQGKVVKLPWFRKVA